MAKNTKNTTYKKSKPAAKRHKRNTAGKGKGGKKWQIRVNIWGIIGFLMILGISILWPYLSDRSPAERGDIVPEGAYSYGIDISYYQDDIRWDSLMVLTDRTRRTTRSKLTAKDIRPVSFVFIKATEGSTMKDKSFRKHWISAEEQSIRKGAYHFFRSSKSAEAQARNFIRTVGDIGPNDLPPVLDIETIHRGCSHKTLNTKALHWLERVTEHYGRKPIVYSSASFIEDILCDEIKKNYPIWVAHYGTDRPRYDRWNIWQFTEKAIVYGIDGYSDLNVCTSEFLKSL